MPPNVSDPAQVSVRDSFDRLTCLAGKVLSAPSARLWLAEAADHFTSQSGPNDPATALDTPSLSFMLCQQVADSGQPLLITDTHEYSAVHPRGLEPDPNLIAFAGVPLVTSGGEVWGTLCVIDHQPRAWTADELDILNDLAASVVTEIELRTAIRETTSLSEDRQRTEERFQLVAWATRDVVWDRDLITGEVWWNEGIQKLFHYPPAEVIPHVTWWSEHIHPDDRDKVVRSIQSVIESNGQFWSKEYRYQRADGTYANVFDRGYILYDPENRPKRMIGAMIDITERKQVEEALAHERDLLQALMDNVPDTIYFKDPASRFTRINDAQAKFLGVARPSEAMGKTDFDFQPRELAQGFYEEEQGVVRTGKPLIERLEFNPTAQGEERWLSATKVPILDKEGKVTGIVGVSRNVTRLKKIEADLRTQRELFKNLLARQTTLYEVLQTVSGQLDPEGVAQTTLQAIARFAGWPNASIVMPNADQQLVVRAAAGQLASAIGLTLPVNKSAVSHAYTQAQTQFVPHVRAKPGHPAFVEGGHSEVAVPLRRGNRILGVLNIESEQSEAFDADDISLAESLADAVALALDNASLYTAIANERSQLQALIKSNRDGVTLIGINRKILTINAPALQMMGLPGQPEDWLGRPVSEGLALLRKSAPAVVRLALAELRRIQFGDEPLGEGKTEAPPRTIHWLNLPVMVGPTPLGRLLVLRDVTEERLLEKMRDDLTYTMIHDLRNPLGSILSALELLEMDAETWEADKHEVLGIGLQNAKRMLGLVDAILDVSRLENKQMPLDRDWCSLNALVTETFQLQTPLAAKRNIRLENNVPDTLPSAWVDAKLIGRVLQNLVGNAIKFTPEGGRVQITATVEAADPPSMLVTVRDTGSGIPAEIQSRLFQKFVTGRQAGRGSGLGLAFCKLAIEAHGGRIWAESELGQGTLFKFTL